MAGSTGFSTGGLVPSGTATTASRKAAEGYGGDTVTLVPGRLRGYRLWRLQQSWPWPRPTLTGLVANDEWPPAANMPAVCNREKMAAANLFTIAYGESRGHPAGARIPARTCSCGFYAVHHPDDPQVTTGVCITCPCGAARHRAVGLGHVMGVVEGSGRVELGQRGWRAEHVRIVALHLPDPREYEVRWVLRPVVAPAVVVLGTTPVQPSMTWTVEEPVCPAWQMARARLYHELGRTYRVPVFDRRTDLVAAFPPTNIDTLRGRKNEDPMSV